MVSASSGRTSSAALWCTLLRKAEKAYLLGDKEVRISISSVDQVLFGFFFLSINYLYERFLVPAKPYSFYETRAVPRTKCWLAIVEHSDGLQTMYKLKKWLSSSDSQLRVFVHIYFGLLFVWHANKPFSVEALSPASIDSSAFSLRARISVPLDHGLALLPIRWTFAYGPIMLWQNLDIAFVAPDIHSACFIKSE